MLLFELLDQGLEELLLVLELLNLRLDFNCDVFFHLSFVHSVPGDLGVELPVPDGPEDQPSVVEFFAEGFTTLNVTLLLGVILPETEELLIASLAPPLVDPSVDYLVIAVSLLILINYLLKVKFQPTCVSSWRTVCFFSL